MRKIFSLPNIYTLLWGLYYTQGTLVPRGSMYSRIILLLYLAISLFLFLKVTLQLDKPKYLHALGTMLVIFSIYGLVMLIDENDFDYLKPLLLSLLPTYVFYYFSKTNQVSQKWIRYSLPFFIAVTVVQYVAYKINIIELSKYGEVNKVINVAYEWLSIFPLVFFFYKKRLLQLALMLVLLIMIFKTGKRGALLIFVVLLLYFFIVFLKSNYKSHGIKGVIYYMALLIVFIAVGSRFVIDEFSVNFYIQQRSEATLQGYSSGRDVILVKCWQMFAGSDLVNLLFGHGAFATYSELGQYAHNDWLEILVDHGILGFVFYLLFWIRFLQTCWKENDFLLKPILVSLVIMTFLMSLFSMSYNALNLPINVCLGYCLAYSGNNQKTSLPENGPQPI